MPVQVPWPEPGGQEREALLRDDVGQRSTGFVRCGSKTESMFEEEPGQSAVMILPLTGDLLQSKSLIRHSSIVYIPILVYILYYI